MPRPLRRRGVAGRAAPARRRGREALAGFALEQLACLLQRKQPAVDGEFVLACVRGNLVNVLNRVPVIAQRPGDEVDVYHAGNYTAGYLLAGNSRILMLRKETGKPWSCSRM